ncbi:MAG: molybdopterin-synthase adenylyltransferase MoeB [Oleiphilaceae bacterium]|nr:molybdopterin-synthase adenylyltransferase MoeB [Oleiphilaceae bacterium]
MSEHHATDLSDDELLRYSRQIMLPAFDAAGQLALKQSRVLIVGLGGLGSPVALYLAAAGVGHLELVDFDTVDLSNLQRQIAHGTDDIGEAKVVSAARRIAAINPEVAVSSHHAQLDESALKKLVKSVDLVLDCTDNFSTRFLLNRVCVSAMTPLVSGAAIRFEGQIASFDPRLPESPCYRCLYQDIEEEALTCSEAGVIAPLVGVIGAMQALEAVKLLAGVGQSLVGRLLIFDAMYMEWRSLGLKRDPACPDCAVRA